MIESLRHAYARYRLRYPIYFFHHLPKCGGTSVRLALEQWFHVNDDYASEEMTPLNPPVGIADLNSHNCVAGHFGHEGQYIDQRYPFVFDGLRAKHRYRVFTFLRDPLAMRCSLYRHQLKVGEVTESNLAQGIMTFPNYFSRILHLREETWERQMSQYYFVGNADRLQQSFDRLAEMLGKSKVELEKSNQTIVEPNTSAQSLTKSQIEAFRQANQLDYALVEWAKSRFGC